LLSDDFAGEQAAGTCDGELSEVAPRLRICELRALHARIELHQDLARLHHVAGLEGDALHHTGPFATYGHAAHGCDAAHGRKRALPAQLAGNIAAYGLGRRPDLGEGFPRLYEVGDLLALDGGKTTNKDEKTEYGQEDSHRLLCTLGREVA
jgi:hypothetical protein